MAEKRSVNPSHQVNRTGSGPMKDKRTKRNRSKSDNKRKAISDSREDRDIQTKVTRPTKDDRYRGQRTNASQWNRWTP